MTLAQFIYLLFSEFQQQKQFHDDVMNYCSKVVQSLSKLNIALSWMQYYIFLVAAHFTIPPLADFILDSAKI